MTVIAYRNGLMACDSCWSYDGMVDSLAVKIAKTRSGALVGQAGDNDARAIMAMLEQVRTPSELPSREKLAVTRIDFIGLMVFPSLRVFKISSTNKLAEESEKDIGVWEIKAPYSAIGSGRDIALGAMAAGASAERAALIACKFNTECRPPVHLVPVPKRNKRS